MERIHKRASVEPKDKKSVGRTGKSKAGKNRTGKNKAGKRKKSVTFLMLLLAAVLMAAAVLIMTDTARTLRRRSFPIKYEAEVLTSAEDYALDPFLVYAVIDVESKFTPDAVSRSGAMGLMQLMPDTADWVAWRQGKEHDANRIFEPAYNIDMGCYLLAYLLDYYDGNIEFATAAYNAGKSAVDGWLADPARYDGQELKIPYDETRNYVKKVRYSYENYKKLYDDRYETD